MGRWNVAGNWTDGVPGATSTAILDNVNTAAVEFAGQAQNVLIGQSVSSRLLVWNTLTVGDKISVGMYDQGYLSINSGGTVSAGSVVLGNFYGSSGSGNVQMYSQLTAGTLIVGGMGVGTFGASDGGKIVSTTTLIGDQATSTGSLSISYGGTWTNSGSATVGVSGVGTLDVYAASASIGGTLDIGAKGTFNLENGTVSTRSFSNTKGGTFDFQYGTLTVDGGTFQDNSPTFILDGYWYGYEPAVLELKNNVGSSFCKDLVVGDDDRGGSLTISGGTQFSSDNAYIARSSFGDQNSTVTVTGAGSTWNSNGSVYVGGSASAAGDTGSLTVTAGGHVGVTGTLKVWNNGTLTLDGGSITTPSFDNSAAGLFNFYDGTLTVNGGSFHHGSTTLYIDGSTATAAPALVLNNATPAVTYTAMRIGNSRQGNLTLSGGTDLHCTGLPYIGFQSSAIGTVEVTGSGTTWTNDSNVYLGVWGTSQGVLNISGGGQVTNAGGRMGYTANTQGSVNVDGDGVEFKQQVLSADIAVDEYGRHSAEPEFGGDLPVNGLVFGMFEEDGSVADILERRVLLFDQRLDKSECFGDLRPRIARIQRVALFVDGGRAGDHDVGHVRFPHVCAARKR
jgi:T5SS/PEP-CTERM-associated repeat protein